MTLVVSDFASRFARKSELMGRITQSLSLTPHSLVLAQPYQPSLVIQHCVFFGPFAELFAPPLSVAVARRFIP